jgi:hypothetical protein
MIRVQFAEHLKRHPDRSRSYGTAVMAHSINTLMKLIILLAISFAIAGSELEKIYRVPVIIGAFLLAVVVLYVDFLRRRKSLKCTECSESIKRRGHTRIIDGKVHRLCRDCNRRWEDRESYKSVVMFQARHSHKPPDLDLPELSGKK